MEWSDVHLTHLIVERALAEDLRTALLISGFFFPAVVLPENGRLVQICGSCVFFWRGFTLRSTSKKDGRVFFSRALGGVWEFVCNVIGFFGEITLQYRWCAGFCSTRASLCGMILVIYSDFIREGYFPLRLFGNGSLHFSLLVEAVDFPNRTHKKVEDFFTGVVAATKFLSWRTRLIREWCSYRGRRAWV